jgi:hypothetical protein
VSDYEAYYIGPKLADLFDDTPVKRTCLRMADTGGDRLHAMISALTPVKTGNLATSWYREPTRRELHGTVPAYVSTVATDVDYAPYVNYGTGLWGPEHRKYLIEPHPPNQALTWIDPLTGRRVFARRVWHSGSPGEHMIEKGGALVESLLNEIMVTDLEIFKREMEAQAVEAMRGVVIPPR